MDIASMSVDDAGAETLTNVLPNEVLLNIFHFLPYEDLITAEQVCKRWKGVVETCFVTEKQLKYGLSPETDLQVLKQLGRYGHSIRALTLHLYCSGIDWVVEIANRFPNLLTIGLCNIKITTESFKYLSTKCCQLKNVSLHTCNFTDEGLAVFLQTLPAIKSLCIYLPETRYSRRVNLPMHSLYTTYQQTDVSAVFSCCRNLHTLVLGGHIRCNDKVSFYKFSKECVTLRKLAIEHWDVPNEMFVQIQHCSLLEELRIHDCPNVGDLTLSAISQGCPNLRTLSLMRLPFVGEEGLKCFARCQHLNFFTTDIRQMTDETLVELSKCVNLREVTLCWCPLVSDRGCAALLAHCLQLELLDVKHCRGVSNLTVDSAIEAVQSRTNGLVLQLMITSTRVTPQSYKNCHPLLFLNNKSLQPPFLPIVHFYKPLS